MSSVDRSSSSDASPKGMDWMKDKFSGIKDGIMDTLMGPFKWADRGNTETNRKIRAFIVSSAIILIGGIVLTVALSSSGAFAGNFSLTMSSLPIFLLGIGVASFGVSMLINQLVLKHFFKGPDGEAQRRRVATALQVAAVISLLAATAALLAITYSTGLASSAKNNTGMIVFSSTFTLVALSIAAHAIVSTTEKEKCRAAFATAPESVKATFHNKGQGRLHALGFNQRLIPVKA